MMRGCLYREKFPQMYFKSMLIVNWSDRERHRCQQALPKLNSFLFAQVTLTWHGGGKGDLSNCQIAWYCIECILQKHAGSCTTLQKFALAYLVIHTKVLPASILSGVLKTESHYANGPTLPL